MKISTKKYATALYDCVKDKKKDEVRNIIKAFVRLLAEANAISQADKIINEFVSIWNKEQGIVEAEIISADKLEKQTANMLNKYIGKLSGAKTVSIKETEDKNLLGGVIIKYGDKVLDGSLKTRLSSLREEMKK